MSLLKNRPAETVTAGAASAAILAGLLAGNVAAAVVALVGYLPAVVTFVVAHGGVRGVIGLLWHGAR